MMRKRETYTVLLTGIFTALLLVTALLKLVPGITENKLLVAGFLFPLTTVTMVVVIVRGFAFRSIMKCYGVIAAVSALLIAVSSPL